MGETAWLCLIFAASVTALGLAAQKRAQIARWLAALCLGYADSVDCRARAVARWHSTISGSIEEELREQRPRGVVR